MIRSISPSARTPAAPVFVDTARRFEAPRPVRDSFAPAKVAAPTATRPADGLKGYEELTAAQKSLLGPEGPAGWSQLTTKQRGVFLTLTSRLAANGVDVTGLKLDGGLAGINGTNIRFELKFDKASAALLKQRIDAAIAQGKFTADKPSSTFHSEYADSGARENRSKYSMQVGFGEGGAFVDMDRYNPLTSKWNQIRHWGEILTPGNIDPRKVAGEIGVDLWSKLPA